MGNKLVGQNRFFPFRNTPLFGLRVDSTSNNLKCQLGKVFVVGFLGDSHNFARLIGHSSIFCGAFNLGPKKGRKPVGSVGKTLSMYAFSSLRFVVFALILLVLTTRTRQFSGLRCFGETCFVRIFEESL